MSPCPDQRSRPSSFPISVVLLLATAGLSASGALVFMGLWWHTVGSEQGWWDQPTDDEPGSALVFGCVLAGWTGLLCWAAARRSRRVFGCSRLATALIAVAVVVGVVVLVLMYGV